MGYRQHDAAPFVMSVGICSEYGILQLGFAKLCLDFIEIPRAPVAGRCIHGPSLAKRRCFFRQVFAVEDLPNLITFFRRLPP